MLEFASHMECFNQGRQSAAVAFEIGRTLKFIPFYTRDSELAKQAIKVFEIQLEATKRAINAWTVIAIRNGIVKDVRRLVSNLIWECRAEAMYKMIQV